MAIPSEYNDRPTTIGATNIKHPVYNLTGSIVRNDQESIGPITNLRTGTVLHPDAYQSDPERGRAFASLHSANMSTWIPGLTAGDNCVIRNRDMRTLEVQGEQGTYLAALSEHLS